MNIEGYNSKFKFEHIIQSFTFWNFWHSRNVAEQGETPCLKQ